MPPMLALLRQPRLMEIKREAKGANKFAVMRFSDLTGGTAGRRFSDRYVHAQHGRSRLAASLTILGGIALILVGLLMIFTPGPGALLVLLGAALLAGESARLARALDRMELVLRALLRRRR